MPWAVLVIALEPRDLSADIKVFLICVGFMITIIVVFILLLMGRKRVKEREETNKAQRKERLERIKRWAKYTLEMGDYNKKDMEMLLREILDL
ncbi:MAG: hypothetical protein ACFFDT_14905 [Candidatus Hodarchaeota archaeon]